MSRETSPLFQRIAVVLCAAAFGVWGLAQLRSERDAAADSAPAAESAVKSGDLPVPEVAMPTPEKSSEVGTGGTQSSIAESASTLVLVSTQPADDPRGGTAALGTDIGNPQTYVRGAKLANGAILREIHANRVVLELAGRTATLYVAGSEFLRRPGSAEPPRMLESERRRLVEGAIQLASVGGAPPQAQQLAKPTGGRSGFIRAQQQVVDGLVQGYRLTPGADSASFAKLGFRSGDVLIAVDGSPVDDDSDVSNFVASVGRGGMHSVTVMRGSATESIDVNGT